MICVFLHNNLTNLTITRPGFRLGAPTKRKVTTTPFLYKTYKEILFQKVALGQLLHVVQNGSSKQHVKTRTVARQSQQSENYTARRPFASTKQKHKIATHICYVKYVGNSFSRRLPWVNYYTLYIMDPQETCSKHVFLHTYNNNT